MRFRISLWSLMWVVTSISAFVATTLSLIDNWRSLQYYFVRDMPQQEIDAVAAHAYTAGLSGVICGFTFVLAVVAMMAAWRGRIK